VRQGFKDHNLELDGAAGFCGTVLKNFIGTATHVAFNARQFARLKFKAR
jgi:hypothetical protein